MSRTIFKVTIFAIAFGLVEAAVVVYLRHLLGASGPEIERAKILLLLPGIAFLEPQTALLIIRDTELLRVERLREMGTLMMLLSVALLAGKTIREKVAFFFFIFGVWDIFYYVFLRLTIGWPRSLSDLDVFFLLPTPWVGPVVVPLVISTILVTGALIFLYFVNRSPQET